VYRLGDVWLLLPAISCPAPIFLCDAKSLQRP
jgi:hypothetical protein